MNQTIYLYCGIAAAILTLGTDRLAGRLWKGYSFIEQSMSDLSAAGSPVRSLVAGLTLVTSALMIAFGVGIWQAAGQALLGRIVSICVIGNAAAGLVATLFFPNRFGERPVFGSPGVLIMFSSVLFFILAILFGAAAYSGWMRILSAAIPAGYVLLAILRFASAAPTTGQAVTLIGAQERTMGYSYLIWVVSLAVYLLLASRTGP